MRKIPVVLLFIVAILLALTYLLLAGILNVLILIPAREIAKLAEWVAK